MWPGPTLFVLAMVFGVQLVVSGILRLIAAIAEERVGGATRALMASLVGLLATKTAS